MLFLDEPFAALDAPTRETLLDDLGRVLGASGTTTVLITHDRAEALRLGDRVAVLLEGRLAEIGPPERVFGVPSARPWPASSASRISCPGACISHGDGLVEVDVGPRRVTVAGTGEPGERVLVGLRPEDLTLEVATPRGATSAQNRLCGPASSASRRSGPSGGSRLDCGMPLYRARDASGRRDARARAWMSPVEVTFKATAVAPRPSGPGAAP